MQGTVCPDCRGTPAASPGLFSLRLPRHRRAPGSCAFARRATLGRAELLGPGAPARAPGPLGRQGDPVSHRRRLSAAELRSRRRDTRGLRRRDRPGDLRGARNRLHDPGAALRYADQFADDRQRRRRHRLDRGDAGDRAPRSTSRSPTTRRRRASSRERGSRPPSPARRRSPERRSASSPAPREA